MSKCKTKTIQTDLDTFQHNQTYPGIIWAYSDMFRTLSYLDIFETMVYPKLCHIHNYSIFGTPMY